MIDREKIGDFDLARLTPVGWFIALFSVAGGMAIGISVGFALKAEFQGPNGKTPKWTVTLGGVLGSACIVVLFLSAQWLLNRFGIQVVRPGKNSQGDAELVEIDPGEMGAGPPPSISGALGFLDQEQVEIKGLPLSRPTQVVVGLILVLLGYFLYLLTQLPEQGPHLLERQVVSLFLGLLGIVSIFPWGRPYTLRFVFGLFSLTMIGIACLSMISPKPNIGLVFGAIFFALLSGSYAWSGRVIYLEFGLDHMGIVTTQHRLKLTNNSRHLLLILTDPDGLDYWIRPKESLELKNKNNCMNVDFVLEENDWGLTVACQGRQGPVEVFAKDKLLQGGYQRPEGWLSHD